VMWLPAREANSCSVPTKHGAARRCVPSGSGVAPADPSQGRPQRRDDLIARRAAAGAAPALLTPVPPAALT